MDYLPQLAIVGLFLLWPLVALRLQRVRSLSYPERIQCRVLEPADPPRGYADLFRAATEDLRKAGFEQVACMELDWGPGYGRPKPFCVYRHPAESTEVAVFMPDESRPNVLRYSASNHLSGGTVLSTFSYDPRSAAASTARFLRRSVPTDSLQELLAAHRAWRNEFPDADAPESSDAADMAKATEENYLQLLKDLVEEGRLKPAKNGRLKPPWRLVSPLLRAEDQAPKPPADTAFVPLHRQVVLLRDAEHPGTAQGSRRWGRFVLSALAFAVLGGLVWGWQSAVALLGVVAFHEFGHFLAMRRFGYKQVRMVLIPLLGGVATGVESDPSGTRRAVVSLAGPLPGIIVGWALLAAYIGTLGEGSFSPPNPILSTTAFALLALNYLNLLPISPLDGGRIVEALIPRSWMAVEGAVTWAAALAGLWLAWRLQFPLLGVLVIWHLAGQRRLWADRRLADRLASTLGEEGLRCPKVDVHLLKTLAREGQRESTASRIARARSIRNLLTVRPPASGARLAIVAVYLAAFLLPFLMVPQAARSVTSQLGLDRSGTSDGGERLQRYQQEAGGKSVNELLGAVAVHNSYRALLQCGVPQGAFTGTAQAQRVQTQGFDDASLDEAEERLGVTLPEEYRRLVLSPAAPAANLRPPADLVVARSAAEDLPFDRSGSTVRLSSTGGTAAERLPVDPVLDTVVVSARLRETVLLKVGDDPAIACCRVLVGDLEGGLTGYPSIRAWLEAQYPSARENARLASGLVDRNRRALQETAGLGVGDLVGLIERNVTSYPREAWESLDRSPVREEDLAELDRRLETALPEDYKAFLRASNGLPQLELLPVTSVRRATGSDWPSGRRGERRTRLVGAGGNVQGDYTYPEGARDRAIVIASLPPVKGVTFDPSAVLVPDAAGWRYVNLQTNCAYQGFDQYLRSEYARQRTYDTGPTRPAID